MALRFNRGYRLFNRSFIDKERSKQISLFLDVVYRESRDKHPKGDMDLTILAIDLRKVKQRIF